MAEKGLGAGLGALFGEDALEDDIKDFMYLPISKVEPRKDQPRDKFEMDALEDLADSIKEHGIIQPITVRQTDKGYYQIIAGERRWRAASCRTPASLVYPSMIKCRALSLMRRFFAVKLCSFICFLTRCFLAIWNFSSAV